ncbi:MAG: hypothetical protein JNK27_04185 [Chitinophagaceae bacterium]|nr:hypothetical protein [Chitinophagaceae bacterium]
MKRLFICLLSVVLTAFSIAAQEKVTKTNIVGNWKIVSLEIPGTVYYNIEKDSLSPEEALLTQIGSGEDSAKAVANMKSALALLKDMAFKFNPEGKGVITDGINPEKEITYTIDEEAAVITTITVENGAEEKLKASFVKEYMRLEFEDTDNHIVFFVRKQK